MFADRLVYSGMKNLQEVQGTEKVGQQKQGFNFKHGFT